MKRITTNTTFENFAFPVSSADVSATIAGLAGEMTIDENDCLANHFSFVLDKAEELLCTPTSNQFSGFLPNFTFPLHISSSQFLEGDSIAIAIDNCFRDAMIYISDEPSFSPCQFLQMSFGGASACSLKASLQIFISPFDFTKMFAIEELIVRRDRCSVSPIFAPMFVVKVLKGATAVRAVREYRFAKRFWSPSYYVGTAGTVTEQTIQKYIQEQQETR